jgi:hypothetical protein
MLLHVNRYFVGTLTICYVLNYFIIKHKKQLYLLCLKLKLKIKRLGVVGNGLYTNSLGAK